MITVYTYNLQGLYVSTSLAQEDPMRPGEALVPARATTVPPPTYGEGEAAKWENGTWSVVNDNRGTWYNIYDQEETVNFNYNDPVPADSTKVVPPEGQPTWQFTGTVWERTLESAKLEKYTELREAESDSLATPYTYMGHEFYPYMDTITSLLLYQRLLQGSTDVVDANGAVGTFNDPELRTLVEELTILNHGSRINLALKTIEVDNATTIAEVDGVVW